MVCKRPLVRTTIAMIIIIITTTITTTAAVLETFVQEAADAVRCGVESASPVCIPTGAAWLEAVAFDLGGATVITCRMASLPEPLLGLGSGDALPIIYAIVISGAGAVFILTLMQFHMSRQDVMPVKGDIAYRTDIGKIFEMAPSVTVARRGTCKFPATVSAGKQGGAH